MEGLKNLGEWIDRLTPLFGLLFAFVTWLTGLFQQAFFSRWKTARQRRLWGLKKKVDCEIILPIRYGFLQQTFLGQKEFTSTKSFDYITLDEGKTAMELSQLFVNEKLHLISDFKQADIANNKFCLGSMLANDYTIRFLKGEMGFRLKQGFSRGSSPATLLQPELEYVREFLTQREDGYAVYIGEGSERIAYPYDKDGDYFVWIKVCGEDFQQKGHGTLHFFMSDKANTVTQAIQFISANYEEFYARFKRNHHLHHHFILMRYTATKEFDLNSFWDVTEKML